MATGDRQSVLRAAGDWLERRFEIERDQLPVWLPVGFGLGIALWFLMPTRENWVALILGAAALTVVGSGFDRTSRATRGLAIFAAACALGCALIWLRAESIDTVQLERPVVSAFTAQIESVEPLPAREAVRLVMRRPSDSAIPDRFRVNVDEADIPEAAVPGAWVQLRARLMPPPEAGIPGAYDFARRAWFEGLGATGRALGDVRLVRPASQQSWAAWLEMRQMQLAYHVRTRVDGGSGAIAATLATGDRSAIDEQDAEAMRRSGLAHLLAISGLHVTAVVGVVMLIVLKLLALSPTLALRAPLVLISAGTGAMAGLGYTIFTGAEVPTVRACAAAMLVLVGIALGRDAITLRLVAAGALIVLLFWPETLVGPSFQLSFAAVIAIVALHEQPAVKRLLSRRDEPGHKKVGRFLLGLFLTGLAVEIALMPIALYHFNKAGLYGALANIVAIPLTTFVIIPLEALALALDTVGLGAPLWWLVGMALNLLLRLAHGVSNAPGAVALLPTMPVGAYAMMIGGGLWLCLWKSRWRTWGLGPIAGGALWAITAPAADILVTGDGRHLALRGEDGRLALLRPRAGDYVRDMLNETSGIELEAVALDDDRSARCNGDSCRLTLWRGGRQWRIFATRSSFYLPIAALRAECAAADIVVSDRPMAPSCHPRWLKADRDMLRQTDGLAITLSSPSVRTVRRPGEDHPWRRRGAQ